MNSPQGFLRRWPGSVASLLTYSLGRKVYGASTGLIAGIVLATSLEFVLLSRVVQYDIPFTFFTTLALYLYAAAVMDARRHSTMIVGFFMAIAMGVLCKGPIGLIIPGIAVAGHVLVTRGAGHLRKLLSLTGIVAFFAVVTPWFVLMERANPGYLDYFIVHQHLGNYFGGDGAMSPRHPEPFYYYLPVLFAGLLPWSLALPQAINRALTTDRVTSAIACLLSSLSGPLACFLFFSAATSKLSTYLLPVFPAAAILLGRYWHELALDQKSKRPAGVFYGFAAMFTLLAIVHNLCHGGAAVDLLEVSDRNRLERLRIICHCFCGPGWHYRHSDLAEKDNAGVPGAGSDGTDTGLLHQLGTGSGRRSI